MTKMVKTLFLLCCLIGFPFVGFAENGTEESEAIVPSERVSDQPLMPRPKPTSETVDESEEEVIIEEDETGETSVLLASSLSALGVISTSGLFGIIYYQKRKNKN